MDSMRFLLNLHHKSVFMKSLPSLLLSQWSNGFSNNNDGGKGHSKGGKSSGQFPYWFKHEDRKFLPVNGVQGDVVVAADGTENFTKIMDSMLATED